MSDRVGHVLGVAVVDGVAGANESDLITNNTFIHCIGPWMIHFECTFVICVMRNALASRGDAVRTIVIGIFVSSARLRPSDLV